MRYLLFVISMLFSSYLVASEITLTPMSFTSVDNADGTFTVSIDLTLTNNNSEALKQTVLQPEAVYSATGEVEAINLGDLPQGQAISFVWSFKSIVPAELLFHQPLNFILTSVNANGDTNVSPMLWHLGGEL